MLKFRFILGSKKTTAATTGAAIGAARSNNTPQVIFNGKILTPQSLIVRASAASSGGFGEFKDKKKKTDRAFAIKNETIDESETGGDIGDKPLPTTTKSLHQKK